MSKTFPLKLLGAASLMALGLAGRADAAEVDRWPGAVCRPVDAETAKDIYFNSAGAVANLSKTEYRWVSCPVRMPPSVGEIVHFHLKAQLLTRTTSSLSAWVMFSALGGEFLAGSGQSVPPGAVTVEINTSFGTMGASQVNGGMRFQLPPVGPLGPHGVTTFSVESY